ncbi:MAG: hypothetical protein IJD10_04815 [Clostridia bacterium]|nr:hypothetical protein [Clostridia bacterium]
MQYVNVVYEYDEADVDIIRVSDEVAMNIEDYVQSYFNWFCDQREYKRWLETRDSNCVPGTDASTFVEWLNRYHSHGGDLMAIVEQHVAFKPGYPVADF